MHCVLVIQDRLASTVPVCTTLQGMGLEVYCKTPREFLEGGRWYDPIDLVIVDLDAQQRPPNVRGWDVVLELMVRNYTGKEPKVIVMTAWDGKDPSSPLLGDMLVVSAYLHKPVRTDTFITTVAQVLKLEGLPPAWSG